MQVTKVIITPVEDGSFAVECEHEGDNPAGPAALDMPESPEIYETLDEALEYARSKLGVNTEKPMIEGEEDFLAGFKGAQGDPGY